MRGMTSVLQSDYIVIYFHNFVRGATLVTSDLPKVLEREIVTGPGYLARFAPLLKHICSSPQLYPCHRIQNAAVLALCKFMLVSSTLCEDNIQLLFTLLEKSTDEKTRCNIMILLHDLIIRLVLGPQSSFHFVHGAD